MLDLDAGIHLDEEECAVLIEEFECAGAAITDPPAGLDATLPDTRDQRAIDAGGGGLLDDLLVPALKRAVAVAEPEIVAVLVAQNLDLDMARFFEEFLDVDGGVLESLTGFRARQLERFI